MSTHCRGSEMVFCFLSHWGTLHQMEQHHFRPIQNINSCKKKLVDHCWDWDFMLFHVSVKLAIDVDPFFSQHLFEMVCKYVQMRSNERVGQKLTFCQQPYAVASLKMHHWWKHNEDQWSICRTLQNKYFANNELATGNDAHDRSNAASVPSLAAAASNCSCRIG